jgi:benzodiazapine receptor
MEALRHSAAYPSYPLAIVATTASFRIRSALAAWLMIPYLVWTTFAIVLNAALWKLNS